MLSRSRGVDEPHIGKYRLIKTIGKGNFAKVKLAKHVPTGREVCCFLYSINQSIRITLFSIIGNIANSGKQSNSCVANIRLLFERKNESSELPIWYLKHKHTYKHTLHIYNIS